MKILANRLDRGFYQYQEEFEQKAMEVLRSGWYVLGQEVEAFENEFAQYIAGKYCVGLASGLDALWIAFRILEIGKGDEVIVQSNAYIASVMGITINGATPIFVEPDTYYSIDSKKIEEKITSKTKAILVVHLYGQAAKMDEIVAICKKYDLKLVEDCAQSHGATYKGKGTGTFGDIGCFSFYPSKNLGGFGDGGAIVTNSEQIAAKAKIFRNYGSEKKYHNCMLGTNSRLDELQAGLLRVRLKHIEELTKERNNLAKYYLDEIKNDNIQLPTVREDSQCVWHQFVVRTTKREDFIKYLSGYNIETSIHYPIPPHLSEAYHYLGWNEGDFLIAENMAKEIVSLPFYTGMTNEEMKYVVNSISDWRNI